MAMYESEHTRFMREWMKKNPEQINEIKKGRALWWEKGARNIDIRRREAQSAVPPKAYYYDAN